MSTIKSKFKVGHMVMTPGVETEIPRSELLFALKRHLQGEWGEELCDEDKAANDEALVVGNRLLSAYKTNDGVKFWIITEADRSATTALLPEEY